MYEKLLTSGNEQDFEKLKILLKCHKVCSKTFEVKSNTVRLKRDKDKIQKRFLSDKQYPGVRYQEQGSRGIPLRRYLVGVKRSADHQ